MVMKIEKHSSKQGNDFYYVFFKTDQGESLRTCLYPKYRNFSRWKSVTEMWEGTKYSTKEIWLDGLVKKSSKLIDADSQFTVLMQ